jgi:hypothetical protein
MDEHRIAARQRTLKAGTIALAGGGGVDCVVRNLSHTGACLEVASPIGIPDTFALVTEADHMHRACHIVWRREKRIGIVFD